MECVVAALGFLAGSGSGGCIFEGIQRDDGETWRPDKCTSCFCQQGSVECSQVGSCSTGRVWDQG